MTPEINLPISPTSASKPVPSFASERAGGGDLECADFFSSLPSRLVVIDVVESFKGRAERTFGHRRRRPFWS